MICVTKRTLLGLVGSAIMTLGTLGMLDASFPVDPPQREVARHQDAELPRATATMLRIRKAEAPAANHSATIGGWPAQEVRIARNKA